MGMVLGRDGKIRAMQSVSTGSGSLTFPGTLYLGLLQSSYTTSMSDLSLVDLIDASAGDEFPIDADFYTGRQPVFFPVGSVVIDTSTAMVANSGTLTSWTNNTGSNVTVPACFITDAATGSVGEVYWVGTPDAGSIVIVDEKSVFYDTGDLVLRLK